MYTNGGFYFASWWTVTPPIPGHCKYMCKYKYNRSIEPYFVTPNRPITLLDSNFPGNTLWAWEFHPLISRLCLSQTL